MRGRQSIKKGVWHIGGTRRRRRQRGGAFPLGLVASLAALLLGEVAKPIFKTILGHGFRQRRRRRRAAYGKETRNIKKKARACGGRLTEREIFYVQMGKNK